jgi:hypothetical protein
VIAVSLLCGGTAFATDAEYPTPNGGGVPTTPGGIGGDEPPGGIGGDEPRELPFNGFELATALTLGVGAIGAGSVAVIASRRRRGSSAVG